MTERPFRVGDRVRWRAPEGLPSDRLRYWGLPTEDECEIVGEPLVQGGVDAIRVSAKYSSTGMAMCPIAWLTHLDEPAPARREPDRACRWCHGTGAVLLVFSHAPCECVS